MKLKVKPIGKQRNLYLSSCCVLTNPTNKEVKDITRYTTFNNPAYERATRYTHYNSYSIPQTLVFSNTGYYNGVPAIKFPIGLDIVHMMINSKPIDKVFDLRIENVPENKIPDFVLMLREDQKTALENYIKYNSKRAEQPCGNIQLPTGKGKTVLALALAHHYSTKTLIVVHTNGLVKAWNDDIKKVFNGEVKPGLIKAKSRTLGDFITIGTVQTLNNLPEDDLEALYDTFGLVIQDECLVGSTLITMEDGSFKCMRDIVDGDRVAIGGEVSYKFSRKSKLWELRSPYSVIKGSPEHLSWCVKKKRGDIGVYTSKDFVLLPLKEITREYWIPVKMPENNKVNTIEDFTLVDVISSKELPFSGEVYDFTVSNCNHSFIANGVITHNCHHTPSTSYEIVNKFRCLYRMGLTATPERKDGLSFLMSLYFGGFCYHYNDLLEKDQKTDKDILPFEVIHTSMSFSFVPMIRPTPHGFHLLPLDYPVNKLGREDFPIDELAYRDRPRIMYNKISDIVVLNERNMNKVLKDVYTEGIRNERSCIVFFTSRVHCETYFQKFKEMIINTDKYKAGESKPFSSLAQLYTGTTKDDETCLKRAINREVIITFTTYAKSTEGTNIPCLEVAFLVTSINDGKNTEQAVGRIRRKCDTYKKLDRVRVYDYDYNKVYMLRSHYKTRLERYKKLKGKVTDR